MYSQMIMCCLHFGIELSFKKINMIIDGSLFFFFNHQCIALAKWKYNPMPCYDFLLFKEIAHLQEVERSENWSRSHDWQQSLSIAELEFVWKPRGIMLKPKAQVRNICHPTVPSPVNGLDLVTGFLLLKG